MLAYLETYIYTTGALAIVVLTIEVRSAGYHSGYYDFTNYHSGYCDYTITLVTTTTLTITLVDA